MVFDEPEPEPEPAGGPGLGRARWWPLVAVVVAGLVVAGLLVARRENDRAGGPAPTAAPSTASSPAPLPTQVFVTTAIPPQVLVAYTLPGVVTVYSPQPWLPDPTDTDPHERRFALSPGLRSPTVTLALVGPAGAGTIWDRSQQRAAELTAAGESVVSTVFTALPDGDLAIDITWNDQERHVVERTMLHAGRTIRVTVAGPIAATNDIEALFATLSQNGIQL